jgi:hypothetical protein
MNAYRGYQQYVNPLGFGTGYATMVSTSQFGLIGATPPPKSEYGDYKKIKKEGMRVGEIIAHRCWPIRNGFLWSTSANRAWAPGEPMSAEKGHLEMGFGVFSFKEKSRLIEAFSKDAEAVFGTLYLWGDIVEHTIGYRSQYASIRSLDFISRAARGTCSIEELRKLYGVEKVNEDHVAESLRDEPYEDTRGGGGHSLSSGGLFPRLSGWLRNGGDVRPPKDTDPV